MDEAGEEESRAARYKLSEEAYNARPDTFRKWVRHLRDAFVHKGLGFRVQARPDTFRKWVRHLRDACVHKASSVWMFETHGVDSSLCSCATFCNAPSILTRVLSLSRFKAEVLTGNNKKATEEVTSAPVQD